METIIAVGRRKSAVARIYMSEGKGNITVNSKDYKSYFPIIQFQNVVEQPMKVAGMDAKYDVKANLDGGGVKGQAEALRLAIARAILQIDQEQRAPLKSNGLLRRDPRKVERKKPGRPKARKRFQFSKR